MSVILKAPYPTLLWSITLPNPQFNDISSAQVGFQTKRAMNGTVRTYVQTNSRLRFDFDFVLTKHKALELREFLLLAHSKRIRLKDHNDDLWEVNLTNNPFEFTNAGRAGGWPGGEYTTISLQFEGVAIS